MTNPTIELKTEERTRCEVWTRVMGYHRPVSAFNAGKRAEHAERCYFTETPNGSAIRQERRAAA
ncbi:MULTISPECIES: anaerobic ribonucleoside-triphosphate reductase [Thiocapsa]|uniref:Anaerobic ribonucleoside-triphosphate reductase n=1 Tax=Thiocapsa roseopersicina TaxID=1058 RepID=A0A1H3CHE4_THIRO|nr:MULTISPECIES: anaerobic ribonucleoside-triphosphate reductase [Thiocapsa]SDX53577.1 Anaerobic ribonucleoside-triphosphate reductase [Thiocapsa roseopersicina]HSO83339.1 anaerobic ribonucleoside-triphosphate reductase [Thiocapsa sp.]